MPETTQRRNANAKDKEKENANANSNANGRDNGHLNIRELKEMNISSLTQVAKGFECPRVHGDEEARADFSNPESTD